MTYFYKLFFLAVGLVVCQLFVTSPLIADSFTEARHAQLKREKNVEDKYLLAYRDKKLSLFTRNYAKKIAIEILKEKLNNNEIDQNTCSRKCEDFDYHQKPADLLTNKKDPVKDDIRKILEIASGSDAGKYQTLKSIKRIYSDKPEAFDKLKDMLWNEATTQTQDSGFQSGLLATLIFFEHKIDEISSAESLFTKIQKTHFQIAVSLNSDAVKRLYKSIFENNNQTNIERSRQVISHCFNREAPEDSENNSTSEEKKDYSIFDKPNSNYYLEFIDFCEHLYQHSPKAFLEWAKLPVYDQSGDINYSEDIIFNWIALHNNSGREWGEILSDHFIVSYYKDFENHPFRNETEFEIEDEIYSIRLCKLMRHFFWSRVIKQKKDTWPGLEKTMESMNAHLKIFMLKPFFLDKTMFPRKLINNKNEILVKKILENTLNSISTENLHNIYSLVAINLADGPPTVTSRSIYKDYDVLVSNIFNDPKDHEFKLNWELKSDNNYEIVNLKNYEQVRKLSAFSNKDKFVYVINNKGQVTKSSWINKIEELYKKKEVAASKIRVVLPVPYEKNQDILSSTADHTLNVRDMLVSLMRTTFFSEFLSKDRALKGNFIEEVQTTTSENYEVKADILSTTIEYILKHKIKISDSSDPLFTILEMMLQTSDDIKTERFWNFYNHVETKEKHVKLSKHISTTDDFATSISIGVLSHIYGKREFPLDLQMAAANNYGFIGNEDRDALFEYILNQSEKYKSTDNLKNFKKCLDHLDVLKQFSTDQKIQLILASKVDVAFRKSAVDSLPGKLLDTQHNNIKAAFELIKNENNIELLKTLLEWVKVSNKERRYANLIVDNFFDEGIDVEIRSLAKETVDEIIKNENAKYEKQEYKDKLKKLDEKIKKHKQQK